MKKLRLDVSNLHVESFSTHFGAHSHGTVEARSETSVTEDDMSQCCSAQMCTYEGGTCDSTCYQVACGCTGGNTGCDLTCLRTCNGIDDTCYQGCAGYSDNCPTTPNYPGC